MERRRASTASWSSTTSDEPIPIGVLSTTGPRPRDRPRTTGASRSTRLADATLLGKAAGELEGGAPGDASATRAADPRHPRVRRGLQPHRRPGLPARRRRPRAAGRRRPRPEHHPAGHRRGPRLQRPRRRASPSSSPRSASAAWPASAPAPTPRSSASPSRSRSSAGRIGGVRRRRVRRRPQPRRPPDAHFAHTQKYAEVPARKRPRAAPPSGSSSTRSTARAAPSASSVCAALGHDALLMIDKVDARARADR